MYGKNIKKKFFNNYKTKLLFNSRFGSILCKLELRLNILLVRTYFVLKLLQANFLIKNKKIKVNELFKHKNYVVRIGDLVYYNNCCCFYRNTLSSLVPLTYKRSNKMQHK